MEKLKQALEFGGILSGKDIPYIVSCFENKQLKANEYFHPMSKIANEVAFVESGILRIHALDENGNEVTKYFVRESQFTVDLESYYSSKPSTEAFQAVVSSHIYTIHRTAINHLTTEIPNLYIFLKVLQKPNY
jgi:CRP-like cAMP-binding protein